MRVLQLIKTTRGATWALRQVRVLRALGVEVHVALPDAKGLAAEYAAAGAQVHVLATDIAHLLNPLSYVKACAAFRRLVTEVAPDIIHSHFVGTTVFMRLVLGRSGPMRIFQVPGPLHLENGLTRWVELATANSRDRWIASCRFTRQVYLEAGIASAHVGLSYYGLDFNEFRPSGRTDLRASLGLPEDAIVIGMVAYLYAPKRYLGQTRGLKGHEDLIDAVRLLHDAGRSCFAVFVGGAWAGADRYEKTVRDYARDRLGDRALFLGNRQDVADLYSTFDVAVHPSHSENLGGAVESLALGVPTVATDVGGFPDIVIPGQTGWLATARSPVELARSISEALDNPLKARSYAIAGGERTRQLLDVETNAREVERYYRLFLE